MEPASTGDGSGGAGLTASPGPMADQLPVLDLRRDVGWRQDDDPVAVLADMQLGLGADHPAGLDSLHTRRQG